VFQKFRRKLGQGNCGHVAARASAHPSRHRNVHAVFCVIDEASGSGAVACVRAHDFPGRVIGVIEVLNKVSDTLTPTTATLLQAIATSVSIAWENARLYKKTVRPPNMNAMSAACFKPSCQGGRGQDHPWLEGGNLMIEEVKDDHAAEHRPIRGFSRLAKQIGPPKTVALLNRFF